MAISPTQFRAWTAHRQGVGKTQGWSARQCLLEAGWTRSIGGANPYLTLFARIRCSQREVEAQAEALELFELPAARGCTYVVPKEQFGMALRVGAAFGEAEVAMARKFLGVTEAELERLAERVLDVLKAGPLEPAQIRQEVGDAVRNLGEEGKKRGMSTTLPMVLGRLQSAGEIRRQPLTGRLDTQRYRYAIWDGNPVKGFSLTPEELYIDLARAYYRWIGAASPAEFAWFCASGARAAKQAVAELGLRSLPDSERLISEADLESLLGFQSPDEPAYTLTGGIDNLFHLRRTVEPLLEPEDYPHIGLGGRGTGELRSIGDLTHHAIFDRGRIVGFWDYDPVAKTIRWKSFIEPNAALRAAVGEMENFVRDQLGDARSFSLDSPESRVKRLALLPLVGADDR